MQLMNFPELVQFMIMQKGEGIKWNEGIRKEERRLRIGIAMNMRRQRRGIGIRERRQKKGGNRG